VDSAPVASYLATRLRSCDEGQHELLQRRTIRIPATSQSERLRRSLQVAAGGKKPNTSRAKICDDPAARLLTGK
jgi:hypothetical protein